jgi:large subunit ribosomal protein L3
MRLFRNFSNDMKCILAQKLGMTTLYDAEKGAMNVTLLRCAPNSVSLIRTADRDGYSAVQVSAPGAGKTRVHREFRTEDVSAFSSEQNIDVSVFSVGDTVKISGISKAKGFQGVVKRHGFKGAPKTHGHKHDLRAPGSIGSAFPQHVFKGVRMAGRMGGRQSTVSGLAVVLVDAEKQTIAVKGAVPGKTGSVVEILGQ